MSYMRRTVDVYKRQTVLPPYEKNENSEWYTGTANAIYQNIEYMEGFNPEYVLILSGDHIYKMDYDCLLYTSSLCKGFATP